MVTAKYKDGRAFVFNSKEEALLQVAHDNSFEAAPNPSYVVEGDHSQNHAQWNVQRGEDLVSSPPEDVSVLVPREEVAELAPCPCVQCEFARQTKDFPIDTGAQKREIYEQVYHERVVKPMLLSGDVAAQHLHEKGQKPIGGGSIPGSGFMIQPAAFAPGAAAAKTNIAFTSGANTPVDLVEIGLSSDGTSGNLLAELCFSTAAGAGTAGGSTGAQVIRGPTQTLNATYGFNYTAEPTVLTRVKVWRLPLAGGPWVIQAPLGRELNSITTAATAGKQVCLRVTTSVASNIDSYFEIEE